MRNAIPTFGLSVLLVSCALTAGVMWTSSRAELRGAPCYVPDQYDTLQAAIDDGNCADIALTVRRIAGDALIARSVSLSGVDESRTRILGHLEVTGVGVTVNLNDLHIDTSGRFLAGCFEHALEATNGGRVFGDNLSVTNSDGSGTCIVESIVFQDRFESP